MKPKCSRTHPVEYLESDQGSGVHETLEHLDLGDPGVNLGVVHEPQERV